MATDTTPRIRLVKCPRCRKLLPEVADIPVYKCGGCDTILIAKNKKIPSESAFSSGSTQIDGPEPTNLNQKSENKEFTSPIHEENTEGCSSLNRNDLKEKKLPGESGGNERQSEDVNIPNVHHNKKCDKDETCISSIESPVVHNEVNSLPVAHSEEDAGYECSSSLNSNRPVSLGERCKQSVTDDTPPLSEANSEDEVNNESSHSPITHSRVKGKNDWPASPGGKSEQAVHGESLQLLGAHLVTRESTASPGAHSENDDNLLSPGTHSDIEVNVKNPEVARTYPDSEVNDDRNLNVTDTVMEEKRRNSIVDIDALIINGISPGAFLPSPLEQPQKTVRNGSAHVRSVDSSGRTEFSRHSGNLEYMSKCPTTRSFYTCGSSSSFEGMDEKFPGQHMDSFPNTYEATNAAISEERLRRGKFSVNGSSEIPQREGRFSSVFSNNPLYADGRKWNKDEMLSHMGTNYPRFERGEFQPKASFYQKGSPPGHENGSRFQNEFDRSPSPYAHGRKSYDDDKMNLLRMVYELQDQLNHTQHMNNISNGRLRSEVEKRAPRYYDPEPFEEEIYQDINQQRYQRRYPQGTFSGPQQHKSSRKPFSGEAINYRHQVDHSCCHPQDLYRSAELPRNDFDASYSSCPASHSCSCCHPQDLYRSAELPRNNFDASYSSCPASHLQYQDFEYPAWSRETKSDDHWPKDHEAKRYPREKQYVAKRLMQPKVGAAPLIACYMCFKVLTLPADFLLFKKKCHKLRCGSCMAILKFSLQGRTGIVHYTPKSLPLNAPLPSCDLDGYSDRNEIGSSGKTDKFVSRQSRNKLKSPISELYDSPGPSPNPLETNQQRSRGPPLHRLMGYNSPSVVIYGRELSSSASSSGCRRSRDVLEPMD